MLHFIIRAQCSCVFNVRDRHFYYRREQCYRTLLLTEQLNSTKGRQRFVFVGIMRVCACVRVCICMYGFRFFQPCLFA